MGLGGRLMRACVYRLAGGKNYAAKLRFCFWSWRFESHGVRCGLEPGVRLAGRTAIHLGDRVTLRRNVMIGGGGVLRVGARTTINEDAIIGCTDAVTIGADCMLAPRVYLLDVDHEFSSRDLPISSQGYRTSPIVIEDDVWVGAYAVILKGVRIGKGAVIAAHSVVTKDVPEYTVVGGVPARVIAERG